MSLTIGRVAAAAGVGVETVRFYEREGLVERPAKPAAGHRQYPVSVVGRIRFIKRAQELGFTLREVQELIALEESPGDCGEVCSLARVKIGEIDSRLKDLARIRSALAELVRLCEARAPAADCAILASLRSAGD